MELVYKRFPHILEMVSNNLDDQSLIALKESSREISKSIDEERFFWIRIIRRYKENFKKFKDSWREVLQKTPIDNIRRIANAVQKFFASYYIVSKEQLAPLHVAAVQGDLQLCKEIITKTSEKNPQGGFYIVTNIDDNKPFFGMTVEFNIRGTVQPPKPLATSNDTTASVIPHYCELCNISLKIYPQSYKEHLEGKKHKNKAVLAILKSCDVYKKEFGMTPLHIAAVTGNLELWNLIISHVVDKNPKSTNGWTPLHLAAANGHLKIVRNIVENVDDKNIFGTKKMNPTRNHGWTPLDFASRNRHSGICRLLKYGISAVDSGGAGGARAPFDFGYSEKKRSLISAYRSLAITTSTRGFKKLRKSEERRVGPP
jgi:ankyrin repeat protein